MYYAVKHLSYYLKGQPIVIEMDHQNLVTMEISDQYIIQRWRSYLENFDFKIKHSSGKQNLLADCQSRMYSINSAFDGNDVYGEENPNDTFIHLHNKRVQQPVDISFMFMNSMCVDGSKVEIILRDDVMSQRIYVTSDVTISTIADNFDKSYNHVYYHQDQLVLGTDRLSTLQKDSNVIYIDAVKVTTQSKATPGPQVKEQTEALTLPQHPVTAKEPVKVEEHPKVVTFEDITDEEFLSQDLIHEVSELQKQVKQVMQILH